MFPGLAAAEANLKTINLYATYCISNLYLKRATSR